MIEKQLRWNYRKDKDTLYLLSINRFCIETLDLQFYCTGWVPNQLLLETYFHIRFWDNCILMVKIKKLPPCLQLLFCTEKQTSNPWFIKHKLALHWSKSPANAGYQKKWRANVWSTIAPILKTAHTVSASQTLGCQESIFGFFLAILGNQSVLSLNWFYVMQIAKYKHPLSIKNFRMICQTL